MVPVDQGKAPGRCGRDLLIQASGAAAWGLFFCVAPVFEVILLGAVVWVPLAGWRERVRARRHGFMPGFALRLGVIAIMVSVALSMPVKVEDRMVLDLPVSGEMRLSELSESLPIVSSYPPEKGGVLIRLPSAHPTLREAMRAVEEATGLRYRIPRCGNGATLLWGFNPVFLSLESR